MPELQPGPRRSLFLAILACIPGPFGFLLGFVIQPYLSRHFAELSPPLRYFHEQTTYWNRPLIVLAILSLYTLWALIYQFRAQKHPIEYLFLTLNCGYGLLSLLAWLIFIFGLFPVPG
ncbi:MAG TPA: hypothetical protein VHY09_09425 [Candidatus Methylacidiphilales bacterium]|nr:hypothetical protein [Candidatus Methylacidiphilales bacterium]